MKKESKLLITPSDSKNEDFTLSLVDYFHKELLNRGINSVKKASFLEINLPKKYEDKYTMLIIDCDNGKVYLRGEECKDKHFGKLSRFNPQRKSDAYNCVNYSVTRLVNRINKLFDDLNEKVLDVRLASIVEGDLDLRDLTNTECTNCMQSDEICENDLIDLRDCDLILIDDQTEDLRGEELIVDVDNEDRTLKLIPNTVIDNADIIDVLKCLDLRDCDSIIIYEPECNCEHCDCKDLDEQIDELLDFEKTAGKDYIHYFKGNQPKIDKFLEENPDFKQFENEYGKCTNVFNDIVTYEKKEDFPQDEIKKWCSLWDNIIINRFIEWVNGYSETRKRDIELDKDNADIVVWRNTKTHPNDDIPNYVNSYKEFFRINMNGIKCTDVNRDNKNIEKITYSPDDDNITFEYIGNKY